MPCISDIISVLLDAVLFSGVGLVATVLLLALMILASAIIGGVVDHFWNRASEFGYSLSTRLPAWLVKGWERGPLVGILVLIVGTGCLFAVGLQTAVEFDRMDTYGESCATRCAAAGYTKAGIKEATCICSSSESFPLCDE